MTEKQKTIPRREPTKAALVAKLTAAEAEAAAARDAARRAEYREEKQRETINALKGQVASLTEKLAEARGYMRRAIEDERARLEAQRPRPPAESHPGMPDRRGAERVMMGADKDYFAGGVVRSEKQKPWWEL